MAEAATLNTKDWKYRGKPVLDTKVVIKKTGDGLSKAMELDPAVYEPGTMVTVVIRTVVRRHNFELSEDGKTYTLTQQFTAGTVAVIDDDLAADALNAMEQRITEAEDAKRGQATLPGQDGATGRRRANLRAVGDDDDGETE